jgi:hypothetical protein
MSKGLPALLCALIATTFAAPAGVALAQDDGVVVDPGSPTGKEYALPVQRAREQASKKKQTGTSTAPLFGEGVNDTPTTTTPAPAAKTSGDSASKAAAAREKARETLAAREAAAAQAKAAADAAAREQALANARALRAQATTPDGGIGVGGIIAVGVAVLLVGGLVGLWLRRRAAS